MPQRSQLGNCAECNCRLHTKAPRHGDRCEECRGRIGTYPLGASSSAVRERRREQPLVVKEVRGG